MKFKKLVLPILVLITLFIGLTNVNASTAPDKITMKPKSSLYYYNNGTDYISGYNFYRKQLNNGTYAYCVSDIHTKVPGGMTLSKKGAITDKGLDYIIRNGYPTKSMTGNDLKDYYITQSAVWEYFDQTRGQNNWHSTSFTASSTGMKKYVYNLVEGAKAANKIATATPSVKLSVASTTMSLSSDKAWFVSNPVTVFVTSTKGNYKVNLVNAPLGTVIKNEKGEIKSEYSPLERFVVYVPVSSVNAGKGSVTLKVSINGVTYRTYEYTTGKSGYQVMAPVTVYEEITNLVTAPITFTFDKQPTKVEISKKDVATGNELPGATLTVKNSKGEVVDEWVSTNTPHIIQGLKAGEYTLTEKIAPDGYILSTETIKFTVRDDGTTTKVTMYNSVKKVTKVEISKKDVATGNELPGAKLVVKNSKGEVIDEWVSTTEPHYINGLPAGEYTLTETIAPDGYVLSNETIKFTVKDDGTLTSVVMYNTRYTEVPITDLNASSMTIIATTLLIGLGTGLVVYGKKHVK